MPGCMEAATPTPLPPSLTCPTCMGQMCTKVRVMTPVRPSDCMQARRGFCGAALGSSVALFFQAHICRVMKQPASLHINAHTSPPPELTACVTECDCSREGPWTPIQGARPGLSGAPWARLGDSTSGGDPMPDAKGATPP